MVSHNVGRLGEQQLNIKNNKSSILTKHIYSLQNMSEKRENLGKNVPS